MGSGAHLDEKSANVILKWLTDNNHNDTNEYDFSRPRIKDTLKYVYPLFIFLHACVCLAGTGGNVAMLVVIIKRGLYRSPTYFFLCNLALSDVIKSAIVLPITLANLLIEHWIFGSFLCFFLPMMHSFPIHASMLTYMMIAVDRYRIIAHPMSSRLPAGLCTIGVWVVAVCVVLPYAVYIRYVDLGQVEDLFKGLGICWVDVDRPIEGYIRAMFVIMFCLPLAIITFLYVRVSAELSGSDSPSVSVHIEENAQSTSENSYQSRVTWLASDGDRIEPEGASGNGGHGGHGDATQMRTYSSRHYNDDWEDDLNMCKEKRSQKYMIAMVILFAMCWAPVHILILVTHFVYEDNENSGHFDITYLTFTFFGFLSCCINPVLFASWRMSSRTKDRLRGYFRFSGRRLSLARSSLSRRTARPTEAQAGGETSPKSKNSSNRVEIEADKN